MLPSKVRSAPSRAKSEENQPEKILMLSLLLGSWFRKIPNGSEDLSLLYFWWYSLPLSRPLLQCINFLRGRNKKRLKFEWVSDQDNSIEFSVSTCDSSTSSFFSVHGLCKPNHHCLTDQCGKHHSNLRNNDSHHDILCCCCQCHLAIHNLPRFSGHGVPSHLAHWGKLCGIFSSSQTLRPADLWRIHLQTSGMDSEWACLQRHRWCKYLDN